MKKTILYLILQSAALSACKCTADIEKMYRADYYNYSCPQLYQKYIDIKQKLQEERQYRFAISTANTMRRLIHPNNVSPDYNHTSSREADYEIQMKAIENLAIDKHCEGVRF